MKIHLIAMGDRMPNWVTEGYQTYAKRLPIHYQLNLIEIPLLKRSKQADSARLLVREGEKMIAAIPKNSYPIALEVGGYSWSSTELAQQLSQWLAGGQDIALLVGSPEGLPAACLRQAKARWSLSPLTLPHPLVRVVAAEQLYRAWTILNHHPYHN